MTNPSFQQQKIIRNISNCKTAALGGVRVTCTACGHESYHYHSCGDRHCPMCQHIKKQLWIDKMAVVLFPLKHFHVIFTIPHQLNELLFYNQKILYNAFFQSVNSTIQKVCARQIGGKPGLVCTLHTWGSNLSFHPHVHCIVSGGAYSPSVGWQYSAKPNFFVDAAALAITFKNIFIGHIIRLWEDETLYLQKLTNSISEAAQFKTFYRQLMQTKWVVRIETPILGNQQIIEYLARYVHRVAITNSRIVATNESSITLEYNNYLLQKKGMPAPKATMVLKPLVFIQRFLQHVLPTGFQRIRYYGLYAFGSRMTYLSACQALDQQPRQHKKRAAIDIIKDSFQINPDLCNNCGFYNCFHVEQLPAQTNLQFNYPRPPPIKHPVHFETLQSVPFATW